MNPYITDRCPHCDDNGQTYIKWAATFEKCRICNGTKEYPNEEGRHIIELVNRFRLRNHMLTK